MLVADIRVVQQIRNGKNNVERWNAWRLKQRSEVIDLEEVDLSGL